MSDREAVLYVNGSQEDRLAHRVVARSGMTYKVGGPLAGDVTPLLIVGTSRISGIDGIRRYLRAEQGVEEDLAEGLPAKGTARLSGWQRIIAVLATHPLHLIAYVGSVPIVVLAGLRIVPLWSLFAYLAFTALISFTDR